LQLRYPTRLDHTQLDVFFGTLALGDVADIALDDGPAILIIEVG
jgi:hypothetical protein